MKKLGLSFAGVLFLFVFLSCSLANQNSSIAFNFPSDTSERLVAFKDARDVDTADSSSVFYVKFTSTGDWEYSVTKEYSKLEEINNAKFEFENLTAGNKINVSVEVGCNNVTYYKAEDTLTLVSGENQLSLKLKLVDLISDFSISAYYAKTPETIFDGSSPIPVKDDLLTFTSTNTYSGSTKWDFNGTEFNGSFNPVGQKELTIKPFETNTVKLTVTDNLIAKVTKTQSFEFGFEGIPEKLTLSFEENAPENSENILIYGNKYKIGLAEAKSIPVDAVYTWTLNGVEIEVNDFEFDTNKCDIKSENLKFTLKLTVSLGDWNVSNTLDFVIATGDASIKFGKALPEFSVCSDSPSYPIENYDITFTAKGDSQSFLSGTTFQWYLNGTKLEGETGSSISINPTLCEFLSESGKNTVSVIASYKDAVESANTSCLLYEPKALIYQDYSNGNHYGEWKTTYSGFYDSEVCSEQLISFCYDTNRNLYIAKRTQDTGSHDLGNLEIVKYPYKSSEGTYDKDSKVVLYSAEYKGFNPNRIACDGKNVYWICSTSPYSYDYYYPAESYSPVSVYKISATQTNQTSATAISLVDQFEVVTAVACNANSIYVGGEKVKSRETKQYHYGITKDDYSYSEELKSSTQANVEYKVVEYSLNDSGFNTDSGKIYYSVTDKELVNEYPEIKNVNTKDCLKYFIQINIKAIISDIIAEAGYVNILRNVTVDRRFTYTKEGSSGTDVTSMSFPAVITNAGDSFTTIKFSTTKPESAPSGADYVAPARILFTTRRKLYLADGSSGDYNAQYEIIDLANNGDLTVAQYGYGFCFDSVTDSSNGFHYTLTTHFVEGVEVSQ